MLSVRRNAPAPVCPCDMQGRSRIQTHRHACIATPTLQNGRNHAGSQPSLHQFLIARRQHRCTVSAEPAPPGPPGNGHGSGRGPGSPGGGSGGSPNDDDDDEDMLGRDQVSESCPAMFRNLWSNLLTCLLLERCRIHSFARCLFKLDARLCQWNCTAAAAYPNHYSASLASVAMRVFAQLEHLPPPWRP